ICGGVVVRAHVAAVGDRVGEHDVARECARDEHERRADGDRVAQAAQQAQRTRHQAERPATRRTTSASQSATRMPAPTKGAVRLRSQKLRGAMISMLPCETRPWCTAPSSYSIAVKIG